MNKVYALFYNEENLKIKITNEKHWEKQRELLENDTNILVRWNSNIFLSLSRSALVEKANEIKEEWLQNLYKKISEIASIELRR